MSWQVINFYKFFRLEDPQDLRDRMYALAKEQGLLGSVRVAHEGINGGFASESLHRIDEFLKGAMELPELDGWRLHRSTGDRRPYKRLLVKVRPSTVRFIDEADPGIDEIIDGERVTPEEFANLQKQDDVIVVDTRNTYETEFGKFAGAETLPIEKFVDFPESFLEKYGDRKDKTFLFYCTGGIRCEKAVPWAKKQGFADVRQLDGGILNSFNEIGEEGWEGSCFVFDQRWIVDTAKQEAQEDVNLNEARIQPKPAVPQP